MGKSECATLYGQSSISTPGIKALSPGSAPIGPQCPPRHNQCTQNNQRRTKQRCPPIGIAACTPFPGGELNLAAQVQGIAGNDMMAIMSVDRRLPPGEIGEAQGDRPQPAQPMCSIGCFEALFASELRQRRIIVMRFHLAGCPEISACPSAATESARTVTGVMPARAGSIAGSFTFQANPSNSSN